MCTTALGIDVMDVTGEQQVHVHQDVTQQRMTYGGKKIGSPIKVSGGYEHGTPTSISLTPSALESTFGDQSEIRSWSPPNKPLCLQSCVSAG